MFEKLLSFTKDVSDLDTRPALDPEALKAQFDSAPDEVRVYLNKLIDALVKSTDGDSGADNIGATAITDLTGETVQSLLESLNSKVVDNKTKIDQVITPEDWKSVTFQNSYRNYGGNYAPAGYRKKPDGEVKLRGAIASAGFLEGNTMFTLEEGYRPLYDIARPSVDNKNNHCTILIRANGTVTCAVSNGYDVDTAFISLEGLSFDTK